MGLRDRERDPGLPALAGEGHLRPPDPAELVELVDRHLRRPEAPRVVAARWDYARWKPGVSMTSVFAVRFEDGREEPVVAKRYVDGKDRTLAYRPRNEALLESLCERLRPRALLAERALSLWVPPGDRVLRGLPVFLDRKKTCNLVTRAGLSPSGSLKRRKTEFTLLRFKPERRAVYRIDLRLRPPPGTPDEKKKLVLAGRILPPPELARLAGVRTELARAGGDDLALPLAATNLRQGFLLERWFDVTVFAPDSFAHAREAGTALARLHALAPPEGARLVDAGTSGDLDALFRVDARLGSARRAGPHPRVERLAFCHGDFHPDQVARRADGSWLLMDLDLLGAGDPAFDLACWIADAIVETRDVALESAAGELLEGYRAAGGDVPGPQRLAEFVAAELVCRAGSTVRRLELGAVDKALFALDAAQRVLAGG